MFRSLQAAVQHADEPPEDWCYQEAIDDRERFIENAGGEIENRGVDSSLDFSHQHHETDT